MGGRGRRVGAGSGRVRVHGIGRFGREARQLPAVVMLGAREAAIGVDGGGASSGGPSVRAGAGSEPWAGGGGGGEWPLDAGNAKRLDVCRVLVRVARQM